MANLFLGYPNRADEATLSGGLWQNSLPLNNLQNRLLGQVARSADTALSSTQWAIDFGQDRPIRAVALASHNLTTVATCRISASALSDFSVLTYDSGAIDVWPAGIFDLSALEWEDDEYWDGRISAETREAYPSIFVHSPPQTYARYWRVEIADTANADGYIQVGRLFIGGGWQPIVNYDYGMSLSWESDTLVEGSIGGTEYFDHREPRRVFRCNLSWMDTAEAYQQAFELQRQAGIDKEVLLVADPDDTINGIRRNFLGRLRQLSPIEHPYYAAYSTNFEIQEIL
jgi:hypothetical protein